MEERSLNMETQIFLLHNDNQLFWLLSLDKNNFYNFYVFLYDTSRNTFVKRLEQSRSKMIVLQVC